ncbi:MAG TPA: hypothetical protein PKE21_14555 [Flavobacteriales bacterium]|nr:hypothetical protein [Flavobacteriales bacterium]HMR28701.1 hypothetical protein [Flavobacteriales bacterium]
MTNTLPPPARAQNIPADAQWLAGEGAGSWFIIAPLPSNTDIVSVQRCGPKGHTECRGLFICDEHSSAFEAGKPYAITYPSHCARVTLLQNGQVFTLIPLPPQLIPA